MLKKVFFMLMFLPALGLADSSLGDKLVHRLWRDMQAKKVEEIKEYTSKDFQALNGQEVLNRFEELDLIAHTNIASYNLSNVTATQGENIIVVTYIADVKTENSEQVETTGPHISVWKKFGDEKWKWISQADLASGVFVQF